MKLKIGIDIDNVIADSYPAFLSKFNEVFATRIKYDEEFQLNIPPYKETMQIQVLLLDRPWNQGKLPKNVKRVKNWEEIDDFVSTNVMLNSFQHLSKIPK